LTKRSEMIDLPGLTFDFFETELDRGIHGNPQVHNITITDDVGTTYRREKEAQVDIAAHAAQDDDQTVNDLYNAVEKEFTLLQPRTFGNTRLHNDVSRGSLTIQGSQDVSEPDSEIRGDRLRILFEYDRYVTVTTSVIEQIDTTVEDSGVDVEYVQFSTTI